MGMRRQFSGVNSFPLSMIYRSNSYHQVCSANIFTEEAVLLVLLALFLFVR